MCRINVFSFYYMQHDESCAYMVSLEGAVPHKDLAGWLYKLITLNNIQEHQNLLDLLEMAQGEEDSEEIFLADEYVTIQKD